MPTYSYKCQSCEKIIEVFHAMSANSPEKCESCKGILKRIPSLCAGIIVKNQDACPSLSKCNLANNTCCKGSPCGINKNY